MIRTRLSTLLVTLALLAFTCFTGCGADDDGIPDYLPDIGNEPAVNCCTRCFTAINDCHVDAVGITGETYCTAFCDGNPTDKDVACLEAANCQIIKGGVQNISTVCGKLITTNYDPGTATSVCTPGR